MITIKIPKNETLEILDDEKNTIENKITGTSRWSITHRIVFKKDDKLYRAHYSVGATEMQDEGPWENVDEVECVEVEAAPETIIVYVPKVAA